jgi:hypothetical protein
MFVKQTSAKKRKMKPDGHEKSNNGAGHRQFLNQKKNMKEKTKMWKIERRDKINSVWKSARGFMAVALLYICWGAFQGQLNGAPATHGSPHGAASQMPAYYDGELFTVNMFEVPASDALIGHNSSINVIYATNDLDDEQDFFPVIDAIQGEGFNPLWLQVLIVFNPGFTPHQFISEEEIEAAAGGASPEITLVVTDEVYRCSVVGSK